MRYKFGFNFAEAMISLVIIGVVAALTIPAIIEHHDKKITAVKLHKFYSQLNYAISQYLKDNNMAPEDFPEPTPDKYDAAKEWWENTLGQYFDNTIEFAPKQDPTKRYCFIMKDGTALCTHGQSTASDGNKYITFHFYTDTKYVSKSTDATDKYGRYDGKHGFLFNIDDGKLYAGIDQEMNRENLIDSCEYCSYNVGGDTTSKNAQCHHCARLIQIDGWTIKNDYPWNKKCRGSNCS